MVLVGSWLFPRHAPSARETGSVSALRALGPSPFLKRTQKGNNSMARIQTNRQPFIQHRSAPATRPLPPTFFLFFRTKKARTQARNGMQGKRGTSGLHGMTPVLCSRSLKKQKMWLVPPCHGSQRGAASEPHLAKYMLGCLFSFLFERSCFKTESERW